MGGLSHYKIINAILKKTYGKEVIFFAHGRDYKESVNDLDITLPKTHHLVFINTDNFIAEVYITSYPTLKRPIQGRMHVESITLIPTKESTNCNPSSIFGEFIDCLKRNKHEFIKKSFNNGIIIEDDALYSDIKRVEKLKLSHLTIDNTVLNLVNTFFSEVEEFQLWGCKIPAITNFSLLANISSLNFRNSELADFWSLNNVRVPKIAIEEGNICNISYPTNLDYVNELEMNTTVVDYKKLFWMCNANGVDIFNIGDYLNKRGKDYFRYLPWFCPNVRDLTIKSVLPSTSFLYQFSKLFLLEVRCDGSNHSFGFPSISDERELSSLRKKYQKEAELWKLIHNYKSELIPNDVYINFDLSYILSKLETLRIIGALPTEKALISKTDLKEIMKNLKEPYLIFNPDGSLQNVYHDGRNVTADAINSCELLADTFVKKPMFTIFNDIYAIYEYNRHMIISRDITNFGNARYANKVIHPAYLMMWSNMGIPIVFMRGYYPSLSFSSFEEYKKYIMEMTSRCSHRDEFNMDMHRGRYNPDWEQEQREREGTPLLDRINALEGSIITKLKTCLLGKDLYKLNIHTLYFLYSLPAFNDPLFYDIGHERIKTWPKEDLQNIFSDIKGSLGDEVYNLIIKLLRLGDICQSSKWKSHRRADLVEGSMQKIKLKDNSTQSDDAEDDRLPF